MEMSEQRSKADYKKEKERFEKWFCSLELSGSPWDAWIASLAVNRAEKLNEHQQELAKLIGMTYDEELGAEGAGWEIPMEPEPDYFATFDEGVLAFVGILMKEIDRLNARGE